jgi:hypothetical protein
MRVVKRFKDFKPEAKLGVLGLVVAVLGLVPTYVVFIQGDDSNALSNAATACPTLDLPDAVPRGVRFAVQNADHFQPGETVQLVIRPGGQALLRPDGTSAIYARDNGSFAGTTVYIPLDAPVGNVTVTATREQDSDCDEPSVDLVVT